MSSHLNDVMNCWRCFNADIMKLYIIISSGSCNEVKIQKLCSSSMYEPNISISLRLNDPAQCRRGLNF